MGETWGRRWWAMTFFIVTIIRLFYHDVLSSFIKLSPGLPKHDTVFLLSRMSVSLYHTDIDKCLCRVSGHGNTLHVDCSGRGWGSLLAGKKLRTQVWTTYVLNLVSLHDSKLYIHCNMNGRRRTKIEIQILW